MRMHQRFHNMPFITVLELTWAVIPTNMGKPIQSLPTNTAYSKQYYTGPNQLWGVLSLANESNLMKVIKTAWLSKSKVLLKDEWMNGFLSYWNRNLALKAWYSRNANAWKQSRGGTQLYNTTCISAKEYIKEIGSVGRWHWCFCPSGLLLFQMTTPESSCVKISNKHSPTCSGKSTWWSRWASDNDTICSVSLWIPIDY